MEARDDDDAAADLPAAEVVRPPFEGEAVRVWGGNQSQADVLAAMLRARGLSAVATGDREVEGGTAIVEALIFVPPDEVEDAQALIADVESGAAAPNNRGCETRNAMSEQALVP